MPGPALRPPLLAAVSLLFRQTPASMTRRSCSRLIVLVCALCFSACDIFGSGLREEQVTLRNEGPIDVHMLGPGETMGPTNRVAPGETRAYRFIEFDPATVTSFVFRVERPEGSFGQVTCVATSTTSTGRVAMVVWRGGADIACEGW